MRRLQTTQARRIRNHLLRNVYAIQQRRNSEWHHRRFGVEIETIVPENGKFSDISGLRHFLWQKQPDSFNGWRIKPGQNIGGHGNDGIYFGAELISPILDWNDKEIKSIKNICNELQQIPAMTNYSTAFHVHCAATDLTEAEIKNIAANYGHFEEIIDQFNMTNQSPANRNKFVCGFLPSNPQNCSDGRAVSLDRRNQSQKRYFALNSDVLSTENEHHHGTVDAESVLKWIRFNLVLIHKSKSEGIFDFMQEKKNFDERRKAFWEFIDDEELQTYYKQKTDTKAHIMLMEPTYTGYDEEGAYVKRWNEVFTEYYDGAKYFESPNEDVRVYYNGDTEAWLITQGKRVNIAMSQYIQLRQTIRRKYAGAL